MELRKVVKAVAGAASAVAASGTTVFATVPDGVELPWYAWVGIGIFNAALGFAVVYLAPRNATF